MEGGEKPGGAKGQSALPEAGRTTCMPTNMPPCLPKTNFSRRMKTPCSVRFLRMHGNGPIH